MERVLQSDERHEREHEDKPRGFPARHKGKRRESKCDERRCGGNDGLDAEHATQSLVGKDETCRDHQLHGTESKGGKRHRDVDRPIARAHFPIMYKHAVHAPHYAQTPHDAPYAMRGIRAKPEAESGGKTSKAIVERGILGDAAGILPDDKRGEPARR